MKLTPICYYDPEPEHDITCSRCGRHILYAHVVVEDTAEILLGKECIIALRKTGEIEGRLPRNGRYDWRMADVREEAYYNWYCSSVAHAE